MRRLVLVALVVAGIVMASQPAGAAENQAVTTAGQTLIGLLDPDGEPCTGVPNQLPGIFDFSSACAAHDACWVSGGDNTACNLAFRQNMLALCTAQHPAVLDPARYTCQTFAVLYYTGVVIFDQLI